MWFERQFEIQVDVSIGHECRWTTSIFWSAVSGKKSKKKFSRLKSVAYKDWNWKRNVPLNSRRFYCVSHRHVISLYWNIENYSNCSFLSVLGLCCILTAKIMCLHAHRHAQMILLMRLQWNHSLTLRLSYIFIVKCRLCLSYLHCQHSDLKNKCSRCNIVTMRHDFQV